LFENGDWNFNKLYTQLPSFYQNCIRIITLDHDTEDKLIWSASPNGQYSASYGYMWLDHNLTQQVEPVNCWSWIWRLQVSENLRHFCWLVMHASLPTNAFRGSRHLTSDTSCHRCGAFVESDMHTLRDCPMAKNIWRQLSSTYSNDFYIQDCQLWFKRHAVRETGTGFIVAYYEILRNRNEEIFQNVRKATWESVNNIISYHSSMVHALGPTNKRHVTRQVRWNPPPEDFIKINVDGSTFGNPGNAGFGGLLRNNRGNWIHGFSGSCGRATNLLAELSAIWKGLQLAWDLGYRSIIMESDSQAALDLIVDTKQKDFHPHATLLSLIRKLSSLPWVVSFSHTLREGNKCAVWLAKFGATNTDSLKMWTSPPPQLDIIMLADTSGVFRQRIG
jgi:ribonuclease HI